MARARPSARPGTAGTTPVTLVADGAYRVTLAAYDAAGNRVARSLDVVVDTRRPAVPVDGARDALAQRDGLGDAAAIKWTSDETASGTVSLLRGSNVLRRWSVSASTGATHHLERPHDERRRRQRWAGTASASRSATRRQPDDHRPHPHRRPDAGLPAWARHFYPQDRDALAATSHDSFKLIRAAYVSLRIVDGGRSCRSHRLDRPLDGGRDQALDLGRPDDRMVRSRHPGATSPSSARGRGSGRASSVARSSRTRSWSRRRLSVKAGSSFTLRFTSVEPLSVRPTARLAQAGKSPVTKTVTRRSDGPLRGDIHGRGRRHRRGERHDQRPRTRRGRMNTTVRCGSAVVG